MKIERLSPDDEDRLRSIRLAALRDAPDAFGSTLEETSARPAESWRQQLRDLATFVAVMGGADAGIVRGVQLDEDPAVAILLSMWVAPTARGKGVGKALVDALVAWARADGFARLVLDVADDNQPAIALYARTGFEPTGETGTLPPPREHVLEHRRSLEL
jgi:ribosomal protein S18 acetylase RimI-like enzyme